MGARDGAERCNLWCGQRQDPEVRFEIGCKGRGGARPRRTRFRPGNWRYEIIQRTAERA
jgi:hypothetical protein